MSARFVIEILFSLLATHEDGWQDRPSAGAYDTAQQTSALTTQQCATCLEIDLYVGDKHVPILWSRLARIFPEAKVEFLSHELSSHFHNLQHVYL